MAYNGHKNWNHWNVSLWINNDEALSTLAKDLILQYKHYRSFTGSTSPRERAAAAMLERLEWQGITHTPDGAPYSVSSIRAAMVGM